MTIKNSSFKTGQNAVVKRTLNLEQYIMIYMASSNIKDLKVISTGIK